MRRKLAPVGVALASALLLGGCAAGTHPGAAAVVGSTEISVDDVDQASRSVSTALGQPFTTQTTLSELVNSTLVRQVADRRSIEVTDAEIVPAMQAVVGDRTAYDRFVADPVAESFLRDVARAAVSTIKLGGGTGVTDPNLQQANQAGLVAIREAASSIDVTVAPRFGRWTDGGIDGAVSGSLSKESAQARARREAAQQQQQLQQQQQQPGG